MIQVRYVHPSRLLTKQQTECLTSRYVPVIPLADLTELVEGLKQLADPFYGSSEELDEWERSKSKEPFNQWLAQRLLTQLEAHRKEG